MLMVVLAAKAKAVALAAVLVMIELAAVAMASVATIPSHVKRLQALKNTQIYLNLLMLVQKK